MSELPEGWAEIELGDVIQGFEAGRNLRSTGRPASAGECGVLKISAVTWGSFRPAENKALLPGDQPFPHERVRRGDLLISRANTSDLVGAVVLVGEDHPKLMLPDKILRIVPIAGGAEPRFLLYALRSRSVRAHFSLNATGTSDSMRNLSQPKMEAAPFTLPPLAEQRRIVEKVETLLADVNAARERLAKVPAILKCFRQSLLVAACSGELTTGFVNRDRTPWRSTVLADVLREPLRNGHSAKASADARGVRTLTLSAVTSGDFSLVNTKVTVADPDKVRELWLEPGDLLIERSNTPELVGTARLFRGPKGFAIFPDLVIRARVREDSVAPEFMELVLQSDDSRKYFIRSAQGTSGSMPKIDQGVVSRLAFSLPSLLEQHEIVRRIDALFALADAIESRVGAATARADKLTQSILAKAFCGELVPTEAELARRERRDYEPASVLLERTRAQGNRAERKRGSRKRGR